jgi:hypothetical protein
MAQRLIAVSFFALTAYLLFEAGSALVTGQRPDGSPVGIVLAVASLMVMPFLSFTQRRTGRELGSAAVHGDGTQTLLCTYLSAVLLVGLVLNATLGWWWADPVAALVIAAVAAKEGWENWQGDDCCAPVALAHAQAEQRPAVSSASEGPSCFDGCCAADAPASQGPAPDTGRRPAGPLPVSLGQRGKGERP